MECYRGRVKDGLMDYSYMIRVPNNFWNSQILEL